jgi:peptide/nickel transport system permease protein
MLRFVALRMLSALPVLVCVALFVFVLLRLTPGDPAAVMAGPSATTADVAAIRAQLGLDRPALEQFVAWASHLLRGNLGLSIQANVPVAQLIGQRLGPTLALAIATMSFAILVAVPLGALAAWRHKSAVDRAVMVLSVAGFSMPTFVLGYIWIYGLSMQLELLPVQGYRAPADGFGRFLEHLILPTLTLSSVYIALIARMTRASVLDVLGEDYIRTARAKGISEGAVLIRHALRNAAAPIITVIGISFALLISGVVVTESVFNLPGLGRLTIDAVLARDYPTIQGLILFFALIYVAINILIDMAYSILDPRVRQ